MALATRGRLRRAGLAGRLVRALDAGPLLVTAPAGSGKTVALQEALALRGGASAWVYCSGVDRDPGQLLGRVVRALRTAVPGVADALGERLAVGTEQVDIKLAAHALAGELESLLIDPLAIVIDDAEHLDGAQEACDVVSALVSVRAPGLAVAVASRRDLPLRVAKLRATGALTELGSADLAFSPEECSELLRSRSGPAPDDSEVDAVWTATEGWPLGVALVAGSGRVAARASSAALFEYLTEELTGQLDPGLRDQLIDASAAPDLGPATIEALGLPEDFPDEVRRRGLPLSLLQGELRGPAYHPLVREYLRERLEDERTEPQRREIHARLADALERGGRGEEAVEHWLVAEVPDRAAAAVAQHGGAVARSAPATVTRWLSALPEEARTSPELLLLEGRIAAGAGRLEDAVDPLRRALDAAIADGDPASEWMARLSLADTLVIVERFEEALDLADGFEQVPVPPAPLVAIAVAAGLAGATRYAESEAMFARALAHPAATPFAPLVEGFRGFWVDLLCGRLDQALTGARKAVAQLEREDPFNRLPYLLGMLAMVHDERGEVEATLATIERAQQLARATVLGGYILDITYRFKAAVEAREGRAAEAERSLAQAIESGGGWFSGDAEITRATIASTRGDHREAVAQATAAIDAGALTPWRARARNTALLVPVLVRSGRPSMARDLVEGALAERPPLASCMRLLTQRAWLRDLEGDEGGCLDDMALAWAEAGDAPEHLVRREWPRIEPLLWKTVERGALEPGTVVRALEAADPRGNALLAFSDHPLPEVRRAALRATAASGHPEAGHRLRALESDPDASVAAAARAAGALLAADPPPLAFSLLGGFAVRRGTHFVADDEWGRRRPASQRLVRFLLVHRDSAVPEDDLFEAFWPEAPADAARRRLQVTVSSARAALDFPGAEQSVIQAADRSYRLVLSERDLVDTDEFEVAATGALSAPAPARRELLVAAVGRWGGEPLPDDRYEDWAAATRARLNDLYAQVLAALADECADAGDLAGALDAAARQVELDPLDEGAHRRVMLAYARAGRRGEALRQYLACRRALVDGLGIEPSEETTALHRQVLAGERV